MAARKKAPPQFPLPVLEAGIVRRALGEMPVAAHKSPTVKRRYSVTGDILSYRRCKRQYGFFQRRRYTSAQSAQLFFGTVVHETLDRAHAHYRGELPGTVPGALPSDADVTRYFFAVEESLHARGIREMSKASRDVALEYILRFNREEGPSAYPRIIDSEHKLQKDKGGYVLHGVVDVIAGVPDPLGGRWSEYEIWDYKGSKRPSDDRQFENYEFQMRVYAHLYALRNGVVPCRAILWFLGETGDTRRHEVSLREADVADAVQAFDATVQAIERSIACDDWSNITRNDAPDPETCDACDLRWGCPAPAKTYRVRGLKRG